MPARRSVLEERRLILDRPNGINARAVIEAAALLAGIDRDLSSILRPDKNAGQHRPCIIGLPDRPEREFVARQSMNSPHSRAASALIGNSANSFSMNLMADVVDAGALAQRTKIPALLETVEQ